MKWRIDYSRNADKFAKKRNVRIEVREEIKKFLIKMKGQNVNIDLSKLSGEWQGYYRIRRNDCAGVKFNDHLTWGVNNICFFEFLRASAP
ncbi:MAG: hypothetical protein K8F52_10055 [Candidatus Scalindua rubra]|uniref:Uncharacterized protein n=1 Tax=Candidatus Scalindua brodae TaxID=237368 RepID=A0A0B0ELM3_9BACT|nr:MAG: hypothetical protein SCABRO_00291 [Candidatus Scalindua brodae]MBZ0109001.1 hypothetical protein [Candidatus Scalindua rubra]